MLVKIHPCRRGYPRLVSLISHFATESVRKKRRGVVGVVIGYYLLRGTKGLICLSDLSHREVCCLPGAQVRDVARNIPRLGKSSDYFHY